MLLVEKFFKTFTNKEICDATKDTEMILALSAENREQVDNMITKVIEAGGKEYINHKIMDGCIIVVLKTSMDTFGK
jgi:uncharacterized protein